MTRTLTSFITLLCLGLTVHTGTLSASEVTPQLNQYRTWTNLQGKRIRATCTDVGTDTVRLRTESGRQYSYAIDGLSPQDQAYSRELQRRSREAPAAGVAARHAKFMAEVGPHTARPPDPTTSSPRQTGRASARARQLKAEWNASMNRGGRGGVGSLRTVSTRRSKINFSFWIFH